MSPETQSAGVGSAQESGMILDQNGNVMVPTGEAFTATEATQDATAAQQAGGGWDLSTAFGLFNILVGLMLVAAFLLFFGGLSGYLSRLGLEGRSQGLTYMYRGTAILFVLILLLATVNYVQYHTAVVLTIIGFIVVGFVAWVAVQASSAPAEEEH